jgi:hypothetical protein
MQSSLRTGLGRRGIVIAESGICLGARVGNYFYIKI